MEVVVMIGIEIEIEIEKGMEKENEVNAKNSICNSNFIWFLFSFRCNPNEGGTYNRVDRIS